jgi:hypothetical protein
VPRAIQKGGDDIDEFFWMTKDYEIELGAQAIEDDAHHE